MAQRVRGIASAVQQHRRHRAAFVGHVVACWVLLLPIQLHAAAWVQRHYGSTDGLPVSSAGNARIDRDGALWLATHDGLVRFDGQEFSVYDAARVPTIPGNRMQSLHRSADGRLYALTQRGALLEAGNDGVALRDPDPSTPGQAVRFLDDASTCITLASGLFCPDGDGGFAARVRFPDDVSARLAVPGAGTATWVMAQRQGVLLHDAGQWRTLRAGNLVAQGGLVPFAAAVGSEGDLWIGHADGLLQIHPDGTQATWPTDDAHPRGITQLRAEADGRVWIGAGNGLFVVDAGVLQRVPAVDAGTGPSRSWRAPDGALWRSTAGQVWREAEPVLASRGAIEDIAFDDDANAWITTQRDGLHALSRARVDLLDDGNGLHGDNLYGVARDPQGTMWLGSLGGGVQAVQRDGSIRQYTQAEGLPGRNVSTVAAGPDGSIYAGGNVPGLLRKRVDEARFQPVSMPEALARERVLAIVFDAQARLWLGTSDGLWRSDGDAGARGDAMHMQRVWPVQGRMLVNALLHARDGAVWLGTIDGVWRLHAHEAQRVAPALPRDVRVRDLFEAGDGAVWASTEGHGLLRIAADDPGGVRAVRLGRAQGLPSNSPHAVREDAAGSLWINSNQGVFRITPTGLAEFLAGRVPALTPLSLGLADGLTELEGNGGVQPAAAFDADGRLWFPSQRGAVRFDPLALPLRQRPPRPFIDAVENDGVEIGQLSPLPPGMRSLLVRYAAADLHAGSEVRFRYRLAPHDEAWTEAGTRRVASFASLAPGTYRFDLVAGNSDGIWSETPATLAFTVPPRSHETAGVRVGAVLAVLLAGALLAQQRLRALRRRATALDALVRERTGELRAEKSRVESTLAELAHTHDVLAGTHREIERSNRRLAEQAARLEALDRFRSKLLADVSHELRTPLMLVALPLREVHDAATLAPADRRRLKLSLDQADRLAALIEQLVGLVQAEAGQLHLRIARLDLFALVRDVVATYQPVAARAGVALVLRGEPGHQIVFADRAQLTTVLGNLIDNACKYAPPGSEVTLGFDIDPASERARIHVRDHGHGFDPGLAAQLFERFFRADGPPRAGREGLGIGLALARELVELHGGRIGASSTPGDGAHFWFELPLGSAHVALDDLALDAPAALPEPAPPTRDGAARSAGRVLLVEDHPDLAAYLADRLGERLPVVRVDSAEAALAALQRDAVAIVVSDVVLPGRSGLDLTRSVRADPRLDAVPVLLISAKAGPADRAAGLAAGAVDYLAKPFGFDTLLAAIARAAPAVAAVLAEAAAHAPPDPLLALALDHLGEAGFGVSQWASLAHLSERQFRRRVTDLTGQAPLAWLREQRLLRVRRLVDTGECRSLAEAGERAGLENPTYLYRLYRARFGDAES